MRVTSKLIWPFLFALVFLTLSRIFIFGATPAHAINLPEADGSYILDEDGDAPDVTARVARISFLKGDAQIRRTDGADWEKVTMNLPVVEGDEITTSADARLEVQFDNNQHLRLGENAYLKVVTLKDEGIALSLSLGTMSVTITQFDKDKAFFEVDAPKTTIAIQHAGIYRIDAGQSGDNDIRVSATNDGEARVYSDNIGFTLKNGRSALVHIDGVNAGEWEGDDSARFTDEFDAWSLDRDSVIAQRLKDAYYDKYYDSDIYGADDLGGYGEWIHTAKYGDVWRPFRNATSYYSDWSPYRYGHWRWVPPFGWTWVNDEPWGWATYHHGRWVFDDGWYWSPYGYHRHARSWWFPALVVVNVYNNNVCWYPLGYHHAYYDFNHNYNSHHNGGGHYNGGGGHIPPTYPTGGIKVPHQPVPPRLPMIPATAVTAMAMDDFGTTVKPVKAAPLNVANAVISKKVDGMNDPILPSYSAVTKKIGREIVVERPKTDIIAAQTKVGAAPRRSDAPLDRELRKTRVLGGREPATGADNNGGISPRNNSASHARDPRKTGAVTRQPPVIRNDTSPPIRPAPVSTPKVKEQDDSDVPRVRTPSDPPVRQLPVRQQPPVRQEPTRDDTPVRQAPRLEPSRQPPVKSEPKQVIKRAKMPDGGSRKAKED